MLWQVLCYIKSDYATDFKFKTILRVLNGLPQNNKFQTFSLLIQPPPHQTPLNRENFCSNKAQIWHQNTVIMKTQKPNSTKNNETLRCHQQIIHKPAFLDPLYHQKFEHKNTKHVKQTWITSTINMFKAQISREQTIQFNFRKQPQHTSKKHET